MEKMSKGMHVYTWEAWKKWVDTMHEDRHENKARQQFMQVWYPESNDPVDPQFVKALVQSAFNEGYMEGFSTRILRGDSNE